MWLVVYFHRYTTCYIYPKFGDLSYCKGSLPKQQMVFQANYYLVLTFSDEYVT